MPKPSQPEEARSLAGRAFKLLCRVLGWALIAAATLELFSFAAVLASNRIIYGSLREGTPVDYDGYALYLASDGFRPGIKTNPGQDRAKRIWFFGGSTLRSEDSPDESTIPGQVCAELAGLAPDTCFECFNFGINSYNSLLESKLLQKLLAEGADFPDLVVFYDGANDINYFATFRDIYAHEGYARVKALVESYHGGFFGLLKPLCAAYYASYSLELYDRLCFVFAGQSVEQGGGQGFAQALLSRYDYLARLSQGLGGGFVLYWQPFYWVEQCGEPAPPEPANQRFAGLRTKLGGLYEALAERLKGREYYVNLRDALCGRDYIAYAPDGVHNTGRARSEIARAMTPGIAARLGLGQVKGQ